MHPHILTETSFFHKKVYATQDAAKFNQGYYNITKTQNLMRKHQMRLKVSLHMNNLISFKTPEKFNSRNSTMDLLSAETSYDYGNAFFIDGSAALSTTNQTYKS